MYLIVYNGAITKESCNWIRVYFSEALLPLDTIVWLNKSIHSSQQISIQCHIFNQSSSLPFIFKTSISPILNYMITDQTFVTILNHIPIQIPFLLKTKKIHVLPKTFTSSRPVSAPSPHFYNILQPPFFYRVIIPDHSCNWATHTITMCHASPNQLIGFIRT